MVVEAGKSKSLALAFGEGFLLQENTEEGIAFEGARERWPGLLPLFRSSPVKGIKPRFDLGLGEGEGEGEGAVYTEQPGAVGTGRCTCCATL